MSTVSAAQAQLEQHRQWFPALANKAYFNYGGQGTMPQQAIDAIQQAHHHLQRIGPFNNAVNSWIGQEAKQIRATIATELRATPETIALTEDVTVGCNIALWGIDWQVGDHILLSDCEHPGVIAVALELQHRFGIEISTCPLQATLNEGDPVAAVRQHLRSTTRLVVLSHILWNTGQVLPLAEIVAACHQYPAQTGTVRVLVDAAQSVGVLPLNLPETGVDFYAFTGHKWWCGPAGIGGLYIHPEAMAYLRPTFIGWRGITKTETGYPTGYLPDARRYEVATSDYTLYAGLQAAIALHHQWGTAAERYHRIRQLSGYLWQQLANLPNIRCLRTQPPEAGLVSFQVQRSSNAVDMVHRQLVQALEKQGFMLRTILDPDCLRACVHYFTLESEIDRLVGAIRDTLEQL